MRKRIVKIFSFILPLCITIIFLFWKINPLLSGYFQKKELSIKKPIVKTVVVRKVLEDKNIPFYGTFEPSETVEVTSKYAGVIEKIFVEEGELVKKGQILVKIDTTLLKLDRERQKFQIEMLGAQLQLQKEKLKKARKSIQSKFLEYKKMKNIEIKSSLDIDKIKTLLKNKKELLQEGIISGEEFHTTSYENKFKEIQLKNSELDVEMASLYLEGVGASGTLTERALEENTSSEIAEVTAMQSNLKFAENQLVIINSQIDNSTLLSPINGRVLKLRKYNGEYISNTTGSLMSLGVVSPISSIFILGEKDSFSVHSGLKVTLETDLYKNREWKGVVRSILPLYQEKTFSSRIKADIENNDLALNPGVFFRGQIVLNKKVTRLLLPISTVFAGEYVFVYSNGRVNTKKIKYLNIDEQTIEVQSGLSESEEVVLSDKDSLREGMEVGKSQP